MGKQFTKHQLVRLETLGVTKKQIAQLQLALIPIQVTLAKPAARNDVSHRLKRIGTVSRNLVKLLSEPSGRLTPVEAGAVALIREHLAREHLAEQEEAVDYAEAARIVNKLAKAAQRALSELPASPTRHKTADPAPIRAIAQALRRGWVKECETAARLPNRSGGQAHADGEIHPSSRAPRLPDKFRPSAADGSQGNIFREIVGICYEACGYSTPSGDSDPVAAIKAFLAGERQLHAEASAALKLGIAGVVEKGRATTSKKR